MTDYNVGDEVICKVDDSETGDGSYLKEAKFQIIGLGTGYDSHQILCFVPQYVNVKASFILAKHHQKLYKFDDKFLGEYGTFVIRVNIIKHEPAIPAELCSNCGTLIHWVTRPENGVYCCRACKDNPYRR